MNLSKLNFISNEGVASIIFFRVLIGLSNRLVRYVLPLFLIFLNWDAISYGLLFSITGYLTTGVIIGLGYITDVRKRKYTLIVGLGISSLSMVLFYFAGHSEIKFWMIAAYSLFGVSGSLANLSLTTLLADATTTKKEKTKSFSFMAFFWNLTGVVAPLIGGGFLAIYTLYRPQKEGYLTLILIVAIFQFLTMLLAFKFPIPDPSKTEVRNNTQGEEWKEFETGRKKSIIFQLIAFFLCESLIGFASGVAIPFVQLFMITKVQEQFTQNSDFIWSLLLSLANVGVALGSLLMVPLTKKIGNGISLGVLHILVPILALGIALGSNFYIISTFYILRGSSANMSRPAWNSFFYGWLPPEYRGRSTGLVSAGRRFSRAMGTQIGSYIYLFLQAWTFPIATLAYPIAIFIPLIVQRFLKSDKTNDKNKTNEIPELSK